MDANGNKLPEDLGETVLRPDKADALDAATISAEGRVQLLSLDDVIDAAQAATMLGVRRHHVVKLLQRGQLSGKRLTATWVTTRQAVEEFARRRRPAGRPPRTDNQ
jgi:hypothetical protein